MLLGTMYKEGLLNKDEVVGIQLEGKPGTKLLSGLKGVIKYGFQHTRVQGCKIVFVGENPGNTLPIPTVII